MSEQSIGAPISRKDGRLKVTGGARYTSDMPAEGVTYAAFAGSRIAKGRMLSVDTHAAEAVSGVVAVLTHHAMPKFGEAPVLLSQSGQGSPPGAAGQQFLPMQGDVIYYSGQPIALVVADTVEAAEYAADLVTARYKRETPAADFEAARRQTFMPVNGWPEPAALERGDISAGMAQAAARTEEVYETALQHHVAMEPHATLAVWSGDFLTLYEPSTWVQGAAKTVAAWLGIAPENVQVIQSFIGGSFGSKGPTWPHVALTAAAARIVKRPVKLTLTRPQTFWSNGYRPHLRHAVSLGAAADGSLTSVRHEAVAHTAPFDGRVVAPVTKTTPRLYACPNVATAYQMTHLNLSGPFTMRGPGETPGLFAVESAMDELSYALNMDPVALRLKNYAEADPENGKPWSSKSLRECYAQGAARFGWDKRNPKPGVMRAADGKGIGYGMATMMYDAKSVPTSASAKIRPDGRVVVAAATADPGTGVYTIMPQIAADALGVSVGMVQMKLGDSRLAQAPIAAGSQTSASVGSAVQAAAAALKGKLLALAFADPASPLFGLTEEQITVEAGRVQSRADPKPPRGIHRPNQPSCAGRPGSRR